MIEPPEVSPEPASIDASPSALLAVRLYRLKLLVLRYWWVVALTVTIGLAIQGYRWSVQVPYYLSTARMMVSGQLNITQSATYNEVFDNFYGTQVALMKSQDTLNRAEARVRAMHPEVDVNDAVSVSAAQEPRTSIFNLQVVSTNPQYAQLLLNAVMDTYLSKKRGRKEQTTDEAVTAITEEISHLDGEIKADGQELLDFQKENNVVFIEEQSTSAATYLVGLNNEMARLSKEHDLLALGSKELPSKTSDETSASGAAANAAVWDSNASIATEQANIEKLTILRDDYSTYLKDMHPKMIALTDSINQEQKFLDLLKSKNVQAREAHLADLDLQIKNLEKQIYDWNKKSLDLNQRLGTFQQLKSKISREENMYDQLAASVQNVNLNKSIDQTDVTIMDEASPGYLIPSNLHLQLIYGAFFGVLTGVALIYFLNRLNDTIDSPFGVEEHFEVPLIGQIPLAAQNKKTKRVPLISEKDGRHILVESYRDLRSFILFRSSTEYKPRTILICSAEPNEGKSTLASNLAITLALSGLRVLLIDADLRKGVLHSLFTVPSAPGLSEYLEQQISWQEAVQKTMVPTLDLLPRGKVPHQPGELLLSGPVDLLFEESLAQYDMLLWDSVPILAADDASNLCSKVDGILFVIRARVSSIYPVRSALEVLSKRTTKLLGIVLNAVEPNQPGSYDKYRYKEYYQAVPDA